MTKKSEEKSRKISTHRCKVCRTNYEYQLVTKYEERNGLKYAQGIEEPRAVCSCGARREETKQEGKRTIARIKNIKDCCIGERFFSKTFFNIRGNAKAVETSKKWAFRYEENCRKGKGLFLTGNVGSGKTHLLAAIIDYIARVKKRSGLVSLIYRNSTSMLNEIRNSYQNNNFDDVVDKFKRCHLLIIDDLGAEKTTDWVLDIFFEIIDYRYANLKPIIIATNLTDMEIKQKLDERIMSRIYEMCKGIRLTGKDHRLEAKR